jgi:uncharacterized membrane protein
LKKTSTRNIVLSGLFIALGLVLPFLTGQLQNLGNKLLPMHIPVLLCGFICGWPYGLIVGFVLPLLRSSLFTMPPMLPVAVAMAFELAAYGFLTGFMYKVLPKKIIYIYPALIISMIGGRIIWGIVSLILYTASNTEFTFKMFLTASFINAIPGIIIQLIVIPATVVALKKAGNIESD